MVQEVLKIIATARKKEGSGYLFHSPGKVLRASHAG